MEPIPEEEHEIEQAKEESQREKQVPNEIRVEEQNDGKEVVADDKEKEKENNQ